MNLSPKIVDKDMVNFSENVTKKDLLPAAVVDEKIMNEEDTEDPMRLLISNGYEICVVDIKQTERIPTSEVEYLKKIATLNLAEKQLPVSVGLFRLGSDAYMIGGHTFPTDYIPFPDIDPNPSIRDKYHHLHLGRNGVKGTSSDTYRLSIANDDTLSPSKCNNTIPRLQSPKLWPVVAEIKGKLHVFDSFPAFISRADRDWTFSHEVIGEGNSLNLTIEPPLDTFIESHLVLGDHIFALTRYQRLLFDSNKLEWIFHSGRSSRSSLRGPMFFETVWDILYNPKARSSMCVEEIVVGEVSYYLVLALLVEIGGIYDDQPDDEVIVVAFLVTSMGGIVGRQILHSFFNGPIKPYFVKKGAIIKGGVKDGKTMCIAFTGSGIIDGHQDRDPLFFTNTFTVELVDNYASNIQRVYDCPVIGGGIDIDGEVVSIHIKDRCVYKFNENDDGLDFCVGMEACFF